MSFFSNRDRVLTSRGTLFHNNPRVLNSRGWLLRQRTRLETTPLFCSSYTDVLMKQRRCFKEGSEVEGIRLKPIEKERLRNEIGTSLCCYWNTMRVYNPKRIFKPPSTPEKPMNAIASREAVTSAMGTPRNDLGTSTRSSCSRSPAKSTIARRKPMPVESA